jgi:IS1 family transposase/transposase-like protein
MQITLGLSCPQCHGKSIKRNGKKYNSKQNYRCKDCGRQFIAEADRSYTGRLQGIGELVKRLFVRGSDVRDISFIVCISIKKVLKVLTMSIYQLKPKRKHYNALEIDEFWTYVGIKKNKLWLIYAYHRGSREIVAFVWGKRDLKTTNKLRKRITRLGITDGRVATDDWQSFITAFLQDMYDVGRGFAIGIERNNGTLRHRVRRVFRKTCCFSKKLRNHWKVFDMAFFYINYGFV